MATEPIRLPIRQVTKEVEVVNPDTWVIVDDGLAMGKSKASVAIDARARTIARAEIEDLNLGTAAQADAGDFATAAQGGLADSAVQPDDLAGVATSGDYDDLSNKPPLGDSSSLDVGTTAGTVAAGDDSRIVGAMQDAVYDPEAIGGNVFDSANQIDFVADGIPLKVIPAEVGAFRTSGYALAGDGGGALYKRVAVEPPHPGKLQSADSAWWEIVLDNGYAHVAWFGAGISALKKAWQVSRKIICTDGETYDFAIGDTLTATGESVDIVAGNSVFRAAQDGATFIDVRGVWTDIQDVSLISDNTDFTVDDGSAYKPGDYIKIVDETPLPEDVDVGKKGEFASVYRVNGDVISLFRRSHYTYSVSDQCRIGKIDKALTCRIKVAKFDVPQDHTSSTVLMLVESFVSPMVEVGDVPNLPSSTHIGGVNSCLGGASVVKSIGVNLVGGPGSIGGYGINLGGTEGHKVKILHACGIRHAFDAGAGNVGTPTGLAAYGAAANNEVSGKAYRCHQTSWGSHHGTRGTIFRGCLSFYCYGGVAIRGVGNRAVNCIAYKCEVGFSAFNQSGVLSKTDDTVFENCHAIECDRDLMASTGRTEVIGGSFSTNGALPSSPARAIGVIGDLLMRDCEIVINRQINNRYWNLLAGTTSLELRRVRVKVNGNAIPVRMIDNPLGLSVKIVINGLEIDNAANVATYIYGHSTPPAAGSRFGDVLVVGGMTRLAESLADDNATRPFLSGRVYDMANQKILEPVSV